MGLQEIISRLPGLYQNLYNHPEYNGHSRNCDDRWVLINKVLQDYKKGDDFSGVRILDIGTNHGYFCFKANEKGAEALGIDSLAGNVELCKYLNQENGRSVEFHDATLTLEYAESLPDDSFDFIFLFSVIHHVCHTQGYQKAKEIVKVLSRKTKFMLTELAVSAEQVYWAKSLHSDPEDILESFAFVRKLQNFPTHLTSVSRPFYICSNQECYINNKFYPFESSKNSSHEFERGAHNNSRKYYFSKDYFIKESKKRPNDVDEYNKEVNFLRKYSEKIKNTPKLIEAEETPDKLYFVRELKEGELLTSFITEDKAYNSEDVIHDVLIQLAELEEKGLHYNDLRTWNVLVSKEGKASLIDFGAISETPKPNIFNQFITFVFDVIYKHQPKVSQIVALRRSSNLFPAEIKKLVLYITSKTEKELSFKEILDLFENPKKIEITNEMYLDALMNNYEMLESNFNFRLEEQSMNLGNTNNNIILLNDAISKAVKSFESNINTFNTTFSNIDKVLINNKEVITSIDEDLTRDHGYLEALADENLELKGRIEKLEEKLNLLLEQSNIQIKS